jgi:hypothetical protein
LCTAAVLTGQIEVADITAGGASRRDVGGGPSGGLVFDSSVAWSGMLTHDTAISPSNASRGVSAR